MKIALICPHFPPDHCGVGDYSAHVAREFVAQGHDVMVWTAQAVPQPVAGVRIRTLPYPWNLRTYLDLTRQMKTFGPDFISIQYTPYLYGARTVGIHPAFSIWFNLLPFVFSTHKTRIAITFHELHYPIFGLHWDRVLIGLPQFLQYLQLLLRAPQVFFTSEVNFRRYSRIFSWRAEKFCWLPVGPGIDPRHLNHIVRDEDFRDLLRQSGIPNRHKILIQFGIAHPTRLFAHSIRAIDAIRKKLGPDSVSIAFLGIDQKSVEAELEKAGRMDLRLQVRGLGYLAPWQISLWMRRADLVLAPYLDGVSTRRSSVITAYAHGKAVLTTSGYFTDPGVDWSRFCVAVPAADIDTFATQACELITQKEKIELLSQSASNQCAEFFAWPVLAKKMIT